MNSQTATQEKIVNYEPLKENFSDYVKQSAFMRRVFYRFFHLFVLRSRYIRRELRNWGRNRQGAHHHILDAGSGFGQNAYYLSGLCNKWSILAVDLRPVQVGECNMFFQRIGRDNVTFRIRDLEELSQVETFQLIISVETLMFIENDDLVLRNFYRALAKGGMLLLSFPACQKTMNLDHAKRHGAQRVRNGYCSTDIVTKLKSAGFENIEQYFTHGRYGALSHKISTLWPAQWIAGSRAAYILLPVYYVITLPVCLVLNALDMWKVQESGDYIVVKAWK